MTIAYDAPPAAPLSNHCDNNDRTCFPHDRVGQSEGDRGTGRIEIRSYDAQYSIGGKVGYLSSMAVVAGPGEVWRAEALAMMAMPEGAKLLGWWPTALIQSVLAGLV